MLVGVVELWLVLLISTLSLGSSFSSPERSPSVLLAPGDSSCTAHSFSWSPESTGLDLHQEPYHLEALEHRNVPRLSSNQSQVPALHFRLRIDACLGACRTH